MTDKRSAARASESENLRIEQETAAYYHGNEVLLDTRDFTVWCDPDDAFHFHVGTPDNFRSVVVPKTVMLAFLRRLDALIGSGS